ncbi:hypothetical protein [Rossellomorea arthrocnemi]|uniref:hypothetical protein n=1 Tax=Rossellomorea arthrocnemi TaxID=2769542 RepID=UPI00191AE56F|nr:hypothetical protein [Rossellomorea arthrocnemi]
MSGIKQEFGNFNREINVHFSKPKYLFIKQGVENYFLEYWNGGHLKRFKNAEDKLYITAEETRQILKIDYKKLVNLLGLVRLRG